MPEDPRLETARELKEEALLSPRRVPLPDIYELIRDGDSTVQSEAVTALQAIVKECPDRLPDGDSIVSLLPATTDSDIRWSLLSCLEDLARTSPHVVDDSAPDLIEYIQTADLTDDELAIALRTLAHVAKISPPHVVDARGLAHDYVTHDRREVRLNASYVLHRITSHDLGSDEYPNVVTAIRQFEDDSLVYLVATLHAIVSDRPDQTVGIDSQRFHQLLNHQTIAVRSNTLALLAELAAWDTDLVADLVPEIVVQLSEGDQTVRYNGLLALSAVARRRPEAISPHLDQLHHLESDADSSIRLEYCELLGRCGRKESIVERLADDTDQAVRETAQQVLQNEFDSEE